MTFQGKVDANCALVITSKFVVGVTVDKGGFANTWIANQKVPCTIFLSVDNLYKKKVYLYRSDHDMIKKTSKKKISLILRTICYKTNVMNQRNHCLVWEKKCEKEVIQVVTKKEKPSFFSSAIWGGLRNNLKISELILRFEKSCPRPTLVPVFGRPLEN